MEFGMAGNQAGPYCLNGVQPFRLRPQALICRIRTKRGSCGESHERGYWGRYGCRRCRKLDEKRRECLNFLTENHVSAEPPCLAPSRKVNRSVIRNGFL